MLRLFTAALTVAWLLAGTSAFAEETDDEALSAEVEATSESTDDAASDESSGDEASDETPEAKVTASETVETAYYNPFQTVVHYLDSSTTFGHYNIYVAVPRGYESSGEDYPVVVLQDGDYSFPIAQSIAMHMADRDGLPRVIVVGIAYRGGMDDLSVYRLNRTRDFTPTKSSEGGYGPEFQQVSGGAERYVTFLRDELRPFIELNYRTKSRDWTYVGHSYGGLLGSYILLNHGQMFQRYLLVSPSLWYDNEIMLREANQKAGSLRNTYVTVFMAVGADENPRMETTLKQFASILRQGAEGGVTVDAKVFEDENHDTVFPGALARGLRVLFQRADETGPSEPAAQ
jgi:predicted alpha/beta superfamily hydrolase